MNSDKVTADGRHYQEGLQQAFGVPDENAEAFGAEARERYEAGMRKYLADPVAPIERRHESFLRKLRKNKSQNYGRAVELTNEIEECLRLIVQKRETLLWIAQDNGIKLKRGIVI